MAENVEHPLNRGLWLHWMLSVHCRTVRCLILHRLGRAAAINWNHVVGKTVAAEAVMQFCAAQIVCLCLGIAIVGVLHKLGVHGFRAMRDWAASWLARFVCRARRGR